jgi:two-component system, sensor histidine kinase and response regulator
LKPLHQLHKQWNAAWRWLTGPMAVFDLTSRIFHSICLLILIALAYNIPFNYYVGLRAIALLSTISCLIFIGVYYLSRFKNKKNPALLIFCITGTLLFVINFFLNSGINGPTDLFFVLTMVVMIAVVPVKYYWPLVTSNLTIVLVLHYIQFAYPDWVPDTYTSASYRYSDISSAYVVVVAMIIFSFYFIRRNYDVERRSAEQRAAMMNLLNEEKNKLFSIISHDLRAPLTNVQNYLELLTEVKLSENEQHDIQQKLLYSTRSTLDMMNNVLSWSKSQMDGLKFKLSALTVHELLLPQLLLFTHIAENKKIKTEVTIDHDLQVVANGDMLQLMMRNLINNAIKFTLPGGNIAVSAKKRGANVVLTVKDSGNGRQLKLSNDIFYLKSESTKGTAGEKGVGLGLVLCKEFAEAQNGRIWFECDKVSGATFFVEMPTHYPTMAIA